jgi:hypothetical protein
MLAAGPLMIEGDDDEPIRVTRVGDTDCTFVPPTGNTEGKMFFSKGKHHRVEEKLVHRFVRRS